MIRNAVKAYIVVPCYNEEEVLNETCTRLLGLMESMRRTNLVSVQSRIVFVDDGSRDATWQLITELEQDYPEVCGIKLAHNVGHQNALFGGLMTVRNDCDCAISIDADLQDDINVIPEMIKKFRDEGCEVVYGVRNKRDTDTFFKRETALGFYKMMKLMGVDMVYNHADFRLMSRAALHALSQFEERNLFLRGMVPLIGFKSDKVYYDRGERFAGESKYPLKKMISFAFDGITSFSVKPLTMILYLGIAAIIFSFVIIIYALVRHFSGETVTGWTSMFASIWFIGGVQLAALGIVGQYVGKTFIEAKKRPRYFVSEVLDRKEKQ